ncbi:Ctr copper transporter [Auriculariales sp. MPI-PUGE-AT-0066]|nr:Ctr copper transporter [Auriculariales sp. MPI-PUGE-AT-0066]
MSHSDHTTSSSGSLVQGTMFSSFHVSLGETLWFEGWVPQSKGALAGAAIGLFVLAVVERWISSIRVVMEAWWKQRMVGSTPRSLLPTAVSMRAAAPFVPSHDVSRGLLHALHTAIQYALMLAIMTFQGAYFIAIVGGAGVGEFLFGRYGKGAAMH